MDNSSSKVGTGCCCLHCHARTQWHPPCCWEAHTCWPGLRNPCQQLDRQVLHCERVLQQLVEDRQGVGPLGVRHVACLHRGSQHPLHALHAQNGGAVGVGEEVGGPLFPGVREVEARVSGGGHVTHDPMLGHNPRGTLAPGRHLVPRGVEHALAELLLPHRPWRRWMQRQCWPSCSQPVEVKGNQFRRVKHSPPGISGSNTHVGSVST